MWSLKITTSHHNVTHMYICRPQTWCSHINVYMQRTWSNTNIAFFNNGMSYRCWQGYFLSQTASSSPPYAYHSSEEKDSSSKHYWRTSEKAAFSLTRPPSTYITQTTTQQAHLRKSELAHETGFSCSFLRFTQRQQGTEGELRWRDYDKCGSNSDSSYLLSKAPQNTHQLQRQVVF